MLTTQEIRKLQEKELLDEINHTARELMKAKLDHENGSSKESHKMINLRRYLARLKTVKNETPVSEPVVKEEVKKAPKAVKSTKTV